MKVRVLAEVMCDGTAQLKAWPGHLCQREVVVTVFSKSGGITEAAVEKARGKAAGIAEGRGWGQEGNGTGEVNLCPPCFKQRERETK